MRAKLCSGVLAAALAAALPAPIAAEPGPAGMPATTPGDVAARARAVLEAHCAPCRERHGNGGALDLSALARDAALVVPHRPDASRVYQRLLAQQAAALAKPAPAGKDEKADAAIPPFASADDIAAVRQWIESLAARDADCADRTRIAEADVEKLIDTWDASIGVAEVADTRFVSLAHLWNACADAAELAAHRSATAVLLAALARHRDPIAFETLGDESAVLAVRLSELALLPDEWDRLRRAAPLMAGGEALPADWLAAYILARPRGTQDGVDPAFDVRFDGAGQRAVEDLARAWDADVDLERAAAERGTSPRTLAEQLAALGEDHIQAAMRLVHESVSRSRWTDLSRALDGSATAATPWGRETPEGEIDVLLWTDKPAYRPRDLVTVHASVGRACHLTLISLDRHGQAIVLFPNELEQDNLVPPGVKVSVPGHEAGYQLRFEQAGEERLIAVCTRGTRRLAGISYDYERQRFAMLGDWASFLRSIPEREKEIRAAEASSSARRRRRGRAARPPEPPPVASDDLFSGRAAITVRIDPASGYSRAD